MDSFARLPLELQGIVIDCLFRDKQTLIKASSSSKAWRLGCYRHLFASLKLDLGSIGPLSRLLDNPFTRETVPSCVRRLYINLYNEDVTTKDQIEDLRNIITHLSQAGRVVYLVLSNAGALDTEIYSMLSLGLKNITSLRLVNSSFAASPELTAFITAYAKAEQVLLRNIACPTPDTSMSSIAPPAGVYSLQVSASANSRFCTSLHWCRTTSAVEAENLGQLGYMALVNQGNLSQILQTLASSLHCLEFMHSAQGVAAQNPIPYELDLRYTTHLQYLSLGFPNCVLGVMPWILCILYRLGGASLRGLQISFSASRQFILDLPFLKFLSKVLQEPQFLKLELIRFFAFNTLGDEEVKSLVVKHISESLRSWDQDGKLSFTFPS